jgi:hypothetical protein
MKNTLGLLFFTSALLIANSTMANPRASLVCTDRSQQVVVSTGFVPGKSEMVMSVNASPRPKLYSIKTVSPKVYKGINGRHSEVPELQLAERSTNGYIVGAFKYDSKNKKQQAIAVFCK